MNNPRDPIFYQSYAGVESCVYAADEPAQGNAHHEYLLTTKKAGGIDRFIHHLKFQKGPALEVGVNGIHNEQLIAAVIDRLQGFQSGPYSCRENAIAITKLQEAMMRLEERTKDRTKREVEGQLKK